MQPPWVTGILCLSSAVLCLRMRAAAQPSYYITTPSHLCPGIETALAVHWFGNEDILTVDAEISDGSARLAHRRDSFSNDSIGLLKLPALPTDLAPHSKYWLLVNGSAQNASLFTRKIELALQSQDVSVFIELDKSVYRPKQDVKIRVICLQSDMRPFHGPIDVHINDPEMNMVQKWVAIGTKFGVASQEFILSENPRFGKWTIEVQLNSLLFSKQFTVTEYVVPKYEVTVRTPSVYVLSKKENVTGTVIAKYSYGEPVTGHLTILMSSIYTNTPVVVRPTFPISGSIHLTFTYNQLLKLSEKFKTQSKLQIQEDLLYDLMWLDNVRLNVTARVTESLTGVTVSKSTSVTLIYSEYVILDTAGLLRPQLNYTMKLQIGRSDEQPLTQEERSEHVFVKIEQLTSENGTLGTTPNSTDLPSTLEAQQHQIPANGVIKIEFHVSEFIMKIRVQVQYKSTSHTIERQVQYWQEEGAYLQIRALTSHIQVGFPIALNFESSEDLNDFNYVVLSKGQVLAAGKQNKTSFTLTPENSWTPKATVNVYYIHNNGKVIIDSRTFSIKQAFGNKVSVSWSKLEANPSENVTLTVIVTEPGSLIGLKVVQNSPNILRGLNPTTTAVESRGFPLTDATLTDYEVQEEDNWNQIPYHASEEEESVPETWIWRELTISTGNSTALQVTVPNFITLWVASAFVLSEGLGFGQMSEPVELHVFQALFVSLNVPFTVTRGEEFILEVILFNYLKQTLKVTVALELSDHFEILFASNSTAANDTTLLSQREVTLPSESGSAVLFPVSPRRLGQIDFTILANSSMASEVASKTVFVKAEGIQKSFSQTVLLEAVENTTKLGSKSLFFTFPRDVVHGSEVAYVNVVGDILGPSVDGLQRLIQMPYGCGEQNMIRICPSVFVLKYLNASGQIDPAMREKAINYLKDGYQAELAYLREDGSFSAFGMRDSSGSTWLTAFVLKCFAEARSFIFVDEAVLKKSLAWLVQHLNNDTGEFLEPGRVIHTELQSGENGSVSVTAYILIALVEGGIYRNSNMSKSVDFLEQKVEQGISSNYTLAIVSYALSLANSSSARFALDQLIHRAEGAGGAMFWSSLSAGVLTHWQPRSSEIETAAYALLSCYQQERIQEGVPIMKWLSIQRSPLGGFTSTQDTVLALQALSLFANVYHASDPTLNVSLTGPEDSVPQTFQITSENRLALQSHTMEVAQTLSVTVSATGMGIAVCQLHVLYNVKPAAEPKSAANSDAFALNIVVEDRQDDLNRVAVQVCTRYIASVYGNQSGMALMEVQYLSGFSLDQSKPIQNDLIKKAEVQEGQVNLYFDSINETPVCVSISMLRDAKVSSTQDATVSIVDYYKPRTKVTRMYASKVLKATSSCAFCGEDCKLCRTIISSEAGDGNHTQGHSKAPLDLGSHHTTLFSFLTFWYISICQY
ncbi:CD109 antigen-like [Ambystoma mexicanum]|uniref:CD109 antigen-like n=1 Tax=Ambystoma mexicanum TaxID=8296 RepID=UPI0037E89093